MENNWALALQSNKPVSYSLESPLTPAKEGYPIKLYEQTSGSSGIGVEDLEPEPTRLIQNTAQGTKLSLMNTHSPYRMKGSQEHLRACNALLDAENEQIANDLELQENRAFREPEEPYKPLLNLAAKDATEDDEIEALLRR